MKRAVVVTLWLLGCSESFPPPDLEKLFPDACAPVACTAAAPIASPADLVATIDSSVPWANRGRYLTGCLDPSGDHVVTGTVTVRGADIAAPPNAFDNMFRDEPRFVLRDAPAGVTCELDEDLFDFALCTSITATNTTIRLRPQIVDVHPLEGNFVMIVEVLPACGVSCAATQFTCEANSTCWDTERDYCAYCLGGTNRACGCWSDDALQPDETACEIYISGDSIVTGQCESGACATNVDPE
jgi:hypothetical protein